MVNKTESVVDSSGATVGQRDVEKRNMAYSSTAVLSLPVPTWSNWTVQKAVSEGMQSNNWVYRCVRLISSMFTQLPFRVQDTKTGEFIASPKMDNLLEFPNSAMSRQDTFELISSWLLLAGRAYLWYRDGQLWPVSPDRISPIRDKELDSLLIGYAKIDASGKIGMTPELKTEEIIPLLFLNPADPASGLSPLQGSGKYVDIDNEQANFNKAAMQNRGELSGFIAFDEPLTQDQLDAYSEKVNNRYSGSGNAKRIGIIGSGAKYQRVGATPVEMDFRESSISNRDKILATFGVPPQMVGASEASTYDNFRTSELVLWRNTVIPMVLDVCDSLTFFFRRNGMLKPGEKIAPDTAAISVLQDQLQEKTKPAETLYKIGVPVSQISKMLNLGIEEYPGWDISFNGAAPIITPTQNAQPTQSNSRPMLRSDRDIAVELRNADAFAASFAKNYETLLSDQQSAVFDLIDVKPIVTENDVRAVLSDTRSDWVKVVTDNYSTQAATSADSVLIGARSAATIAAIGNYLRSERTVLSEVGHIESTTLDLVMLQIRDGLDQGLSPSAIKQNITDVAAFSPMRALRISRTVTGTAQSIGQLVGGQEGGATVKVWQTAHDGNVRDLHSERNGEEAPIDGVFGNVPSSNGVYPRYPLDPNLAAGDRINCRCSMVFRI